MPQQTQTIEVPELALDACSVSEHCLALWEAGALPFWWYIGRHRLLGNFSLPFQDRHGNWWYQVKPGLCWAADCFAALEPAAARPPLRCSFLGLQHVVPDESQANSHLVINAIVDLQAYDERAVDAKRRNAVRKGLRSCVIERLARLEEATLEQCRAAWSDLTQRSGWKHAVERQEFRRSWGALLACRGVSILVGRERESGQVAGFLVTKIIGDTAYVDTIASRTELLRSNVNDAIMFAFLVNARRLGVRKAHYAIRSYVETLEKFKQGLGFVPVPFPARTRLSLPVRLLLPRLAPAKYRRMMGIFDEGRPMPSDDKFDVDRPSEQDRASNP